MPRADLVCTILLATLATSPVCAQQRVASYSPPQGSSERAGIMDSIRLTQFAAQYKVAHLAVMRAGDRSVAIAEVSDASRTTDTGGIFLLRGINQQWRVEYMVDGAGGQAGCAEAAKIHLAMIAEITEFGGDQRTALPASFWRSLKEAQEGGPDGNCMVAKSW